MKTIILAGGFGTRISEETAEKPKPMVLVGNKPMLWHVMNIYATQGFNDFVIATGYRADVINNWVANLEENWIVETLDTGLNAQTGGRVKKCMEAFPSDRYFVTYGDGLGNINLQRLLKIHKLNKVFATVTSVRPPARFGLIELEGDKVVKFGEKDQADVGWINGGFFVLEPDAQSYIFGERDSLEADALPRLVRAKELSAYKHLGFWKPMDTLRERNELQHLLETEAKPPWLNFDSPLN